VGTSEALRFKSYVLIILPQIIRGSISFNGFQLYHIQATTILHVRVVLNIPEHGYSREKSL